MALDRNNKKFTMATPNTQTLGELLGELGELLPVSRRSDGKYYLSDMCQSLNINPWARNKPFRYNAWNFASDSARDAARRSVNQGFDLTNALISSNVNVSGIASKYAGDEFNGWVYQRPRGASANPVEPNRMRDFDGYNHTALPFIGGWSLPSRIAKKVNSVISATFIIPQESSDSLTYRDFPAIEASYVGVAFVASNGAVQRLTSSLPVASSGISVELPSINLAEGTYTAYPFLSSVKMGVNDGNLIAPANVYTLPIVKGKTIIVKEEAIVIDIKAYYSMVTRLTYTITITNNSTGAMTMTNNEVRHRLSGKSWNDTRVDKETFATDTPADFTIQGGETLTLTGTLTIAQGASMTSGMQIMVQLDGNSNYRASRPVDQTIQPQ